MTKYERAYKQANLNEWVSWLDSAVPTLVADIEKTTEKPVEVCGPFGLGTEVILKCDGRYLSIAPEFASGNLQLFYDTGEAATPGHPAGSPGEWNGFSNIRAPLPGTVEEIIPLFRS